MKQRTDIQALRGLAVLLVVLYHAHLGFPSGFLGVDIFFVISGFLITSHIAERTNGGRFSFSEFYIRRAKRLLPACYVMIAFTACLSPWFLTASQQEDFIWQIIGTLTFSANFVLKAQGNYFGNEAETMPLLHMWSLSLEEQYYLLLPLCLVLLKPAYWRWATWLTVLGSLTLCLSGLMSPKSTFYMLPTRAWEMALGSAVALSITVRWQSLLKILRWPAIVILAALPLLSNVGIHPGWAAIAVCASTAVLLACQSTRSRSILRPLEWLGDRSYSLYLIHWPVLVFSHTSWMGPMPKYLTPLLMVIAVLLSDLLYRFVENPLRHASWNGKTTVALGSTFAMVIIAGTFLSSDRITHDAVTDGSGLSPACNFGPEFSLRPECQRGEKPTLLVWGDSFAMHLAPGLRDESRLSFIQATKSVCGPVLGIAPVQTDLQRGYDQKWSKTCLQFNHSVIDFLRTRPDIETVLISSPLGQYLSEWRIEDETGTISRGNQTALVAGIAETAKVLHELGKRVILVTPPPKADFNPHECYQRQHQGRLMFGPSSDCQISKTRYDASYREVLAAVEELKNVKFLEVVDIDDALCVGDHCLTESRGSPIYYDRVHLSAFGSALVARSLNFDDLLLSASR